MSFEIKPESIRGTAFNNDISDISYEAQRLDHSDVADILNLAIQHGIVSPPVYVVRSVKTGNLKGCECIDNILVAPDEDSPLEAFCEYEHWKGQMK